MTAQRQSTLIDLRAEHDQMRRLFQRFAEADAEEKKTLAREMMARLTAAKPVG